MISELADFFLSIGAESHGVISELADHHRIDSQPVSTVVENGAQRRGHALCGRQLCGTAAAQKEEGSGDQSDGPRGQMREEEMLATEGTGRRELL